MHIRRKIMNEVKGQPRLQKALAFAIYLKFKLGRSSLMQDYSVNKIHILTQISPTTIKKYLPTLIEKGWVHFEGMEKQHLVVSKLASHAERRNICVDGFCFDSYRDVYQSLRAFLALVIQAHKDFIKRTIQIATDPQRGQNFKAARKLVKRLVRQGVLCSIYGAYKEFGVSLKRIAKEIGNCVRTAQNTMRYAISKGWATKQHHCEQVYAPGVYYRYIHGYMFSTKNNCYRILANTYTLSDAITSALGMVILSW